MLSTTLWGRFGIMKQNRDYSVECLVEEISLDNIIRKALIVFMIAVLSMPIYGDIAVYRKDLAWGCLLDTVGH